MLVYGKNQVEELIKHDIQIKSIYIRRGLKIEGILKEYLEKNPDNVKEIPLKELIKIAQNPKVRDIIAILHDFDYKNPFDLVEDTQRRRGIILYLDHIEDPVNLGAIIRSAAAFSAEGILIPKKRACHITPTVIRVSEGYAFKVPIAIINNPMNFMKTARKKGLYIISVERGGIPLSQAKIVRPAILVVGSEGRGVSKKILEKSDMIISIEQSKDVNSLNVHVATSIVLYRAFIENQG